MVWGQGAQETTLAPKGADPGNLNISNGVPSSSLDSPGRHLAQVLVGGWLCRSVVWAVEP